ncbi:aminotransferase class I/II-fold pyridoxal phosphate-dependent enzyme [Schaalia hyovaginalis]|uniref:aminotransferase class I/II-fold pyridoxal phosphate-dependent enzyme n=1 Tax=Schaalia hyovaginalis TaxID=29316 RepID=UPI0026EE5CBC|nr:aminotransferase class I/II-fold pyridoxal phosphate-dependent enzyme [Schaalia hyovaginalis]MCI7512412.1 aminotransferase class I/II-fold pyridoxal phosphate-dependent enzyme [Schaalia hyovaginalis]
MTNLSQRALNFQPFYAMAVAARAGRLAEEGADVIRLSLGEPDSGAPPKVLEALERIGAEQRPLPYTDALGLPALREAIAKRYRELHGLEIAPERVCVTAGASAALLLISAALVDPGDEVLLGDPSYPCNRQFLAAFGADVRLIPTSPASRFQLDADLVESNWSEKTRGVLLASPSNPTGTSVPPQELGRICDFAARHGGWRVIDEIYLELADDLPGGGRPATALTIDPGAVIISSFSKYFGMTGWRLGWTIVPEDMIEAVDRLSQNLLICAPTPAQIAALECFTPESLAWCEERRELFSQRRRAATSALSELGLTVPVAPDGAFYVYFDVTRTGMSADEFCTRALEECHVALTPGRDFGPLTADTHVRLSCSASIGDIEEGIARLAPLVAG